MPADRVRRRLAAILAADVVGYSRMMGADEEGTLAALNACRAERIDPAVAEHNGRVVKTAGDGLIMEFASVVDAVGCAVAIQHGCAEPGGLRFRIGVNLGDVMIQDDDVHDDVYGDGVNVAARLEALAPPGGIVVSATVREHVRSRLDVDFKPLGPQTVKNIAEPIEAYLVAGLGEASASTEAPLVVPDKPSIVVLPFQNMSGDPGQDFIADGFVEAITAALSRIRSFFVIARNTAYVYKDRTINVVDIGRELGVAYLLEGSVQRAGDRLRVTVQLIEAEGGAHIWAERYDGAMEEIFDLQDRITEQVAGELQPSIRLAEIERARRKRPQEMGAYDHAMRAMPHVWALDREASRTALAELDQALAIDPDYPLALALAAWCHAQQSVYNWADDVGAARETALRFAERAAELSGDDSLILTVLGTVHTVIRNFGTARLLLERAVTVDQNAAWAWSRLGWLETYVDRPDEALAHYERALRLSPLDPMNFNIFVGMAAAHDEAGRYEEAVELFRRALTERPQADWIYRNLVPALVAAGRMDEARRDFDRLMAVYPDLTAAKVRDALVFSEATLDGIVERLRALGLPE